MESSQSRPEGLPRLLIDSSGAECMYIAGSGPPLVLIPGIQGRWEWMRPAVRALSRGFRVVTFSLAGERGSGRRLGPRFEDQVELLDSVLDGAGVERAVVCGVSYGGLITVRFAATRAERTRALILVSAPGPSWVPDERVRGYVTAPWRAVPRFVAGAVGRMSDEMKAAFPARGARLRHHASQLAAICLAPTWPHLMAGRVRALGGCDFVEDARAVRAPTLVITGEPGLDRVVPVASTREYLSLVPGAVGRTLARTGHIGLVTRPEQFAALIKDFVEGLGKS